MWFGVGTGGYADVRVCVCNLCGREELLCQAYYMSLVLTGSTKPEAPQIAA